MTTPNGARKSRARTKTKAAAKAKASNDQPAAAAAGEQSTTTEPAQKQTKASASKKKEARPGLFIATRRGVSRFRRAGFVFSREPYGIALDALTEEQIEQLKAEPNLVVEEVEFDVEGDQA